MMFTQRWHFRKEPHFKSTNSEKIVERVMPLNSIQLRLRKQDTSGYRGLLLIDGKPVTDEFAVTRALLDHFPSHVGQTIEHTRYFVDDYGTEIVVEETRNGKGSHWSAFRLFRDETEARDYQMPQWMTEARAEATSTSSELVAVG